MYKTPKLLLIKFFFASLLIGFLIPVVALAEKGSPAASPEQKAEPAAAPAVKPTKDTPPKAEEVQDLDISAEDLKGYDANGGVEKQLIEVDIEGTIDLGLAAYIERAVEKGSAKDVFILKMKTFGGRVDAAVRIRDALLGAPMPTITFIDRRAISAGALISLASDTIIMSEGASIGAATPVQSDGGKAKATSEKVVSYMRAEMRATAEAKGRRADIAEAMVDADIVIEDISEKGKLLTLTSKKAFQHKVADAIVADYEAAIALLNLQKAERLSLQTDWGEKLARALTQPAVSSMLMSLGFLALMMELYTAGFGVTGALGLVLLGLFFFGQYAAHLAGLEEMLCFVVGALLLLVEFLVIPGFGIAGILGFACLGAGLVMALVELNIPWDVAFELGYIGESASRVAVHLALALTIILIGLYFITKYLPGSWLGSRLVLETQTEATDGYVSTPVADNALLGQRGVVQGALRPAGIAEFAGKRVDVVSQGGFVEEGQEVEVTEVEGNRVVVRPLDKNE
ncbi:MAG: peptidase [Myxococcales bacterium]|nr:peptidase [Myxococcales bacterium]